MSSRRSRSGRSSDRTTSGGSISSNGSTSLFLTQEETRRRLEDDRRRAEVAKAFGQAAGRDYGEVFGRNVGAHSKLGIPRGLNELWDNGGSSTPRRSVENGVRDRAGLMGKPSSCPGSSIGPAPECSA